jgi:hypothetical protein
VTYLEKLNPEQRRAVEHGVRHGTCAPAGPLLVIAEAGSGKTNTVAHWVAHLIVNRVDPRRILLMTFSRRAAAEMTRRAGRICSQVLGTNGDVMTEALTWAGTFHAIGARLLREYAEQIGIDPAFSIHDREDSADLMNLIRHELGFSKMETRFPTKATCLAIYSRAVNAELPLNEVLGSSFPWCAEWERQLRELFAAYVAAKQTQDVLDYDDLLLYWAQTASDPVLAAGMGGRFDHVLVDEYQGTNRGARVLHKSLCPCGSPDGRLGPIGGHAVGSLRHPACRGPLIEQQTNLFGQQMGAVPTVALTLTDKAKKLWHAGGSAGVVSPSGLCDGHIEVVSVDSFTQPGTVGGVKISDVTFTLRKHLDDWAAAPAMNAAFPDTLGGPDTTQGTMPMQLNNDGWAISTNPPADSSD